MAFERPRSIVTCRRSRGGRPLFWTLIRIVLVRADNGALSLGTASADIGISTSKRKFVIVIDDFNIIFHTILKAHSNGVSMPLAGGHFKVARFSLKRSNETLSAPTHAVEHYCAAKRGSNEHVSSGSLAMSKR
jgi:hypothetical protein